jgi:hypothetical protein
MKKDSDQLFLFNHPSLNIISRLKAAMRESIRQSRLSRDQIAEQMTDALLIEGLRCPGNARAISKAILDKWVSESARHVIPLSLLPVFCAIVGDWLPIQIVVKPLGLTIVSDRERRLLEWADAEIKRREASKKAKRLAEDIGI